MNASICIPFTRETGLFELIQAVPESCELVLFGNGCKFSEMSHAWPPNQIRYATCEYPISIHDSWRTVLQMARGDVIKLQSVNDPLNPGFIPVMAQALADNPDADFAVCCEVADYRGVNLDATSLYDELNDNCRKLCSMPDRQDRAKFLAQCSPNRNGMGNIYKFFMRRKCLPLARWAMLTSSIAPPVGHVDWEILIRVMLNHRGVYVDEPLSVMTYTPQSPTIRAQSEPEFMAAATMNDAVMDLTMRLDPLLGEIRQHLA